MADEPKTLEMRVAELEDKLSKMHITEDDIKAYHKVSAAMGGGAAPALSPQVCSLPISSCILRANCIISCSRCWTECTGCGVTTCGGPCLPFSSGGGGGFGTLGS
jgi:hypothetical protein